MVLEDGTWKFANGRWKLQDGRWKMVEGVQGVQRDGGRTIEEYIEE